jgi:serine/threonine-protein kinase RsbW
MAQAFKELKIKSVKESWPLVEKFADEICEAYHISNRYFGNIILALEESVRNAMVHGNCNDPRKWVTIHFIRKRSGLCFTIEDEGNGFDVTAIPNPLETESQTGTGIFLIRSLADKVKYNRIGNKVEILFTISSINQETTIKRKAQMNLYFQKQGTQVK